MIFLQTHWDSYVYYLWDCCDTIVFSQCSYGLLSSWTKRWVRRFGWFTKRVNYVETAMCTESTDALLHKNFETCNSLQILHFLHFNGVKKISLEQMQSCMTDLILVLLMKIRLNLSTKKHPCWCLISQNWLR